MSLVLLKEVNAKKTGDGTVWKAKFKAKENGCKITISIEAPTKKDLKKIIPVIEIEGHYDFRLEPLDKGGNASLSDFSFEESDEE